MKALWRSVFSSSMMWFSYLLFGYFMLGRGIVWYGWDFILSGNEGRAFVFSIVFIPTFSVFSVCFYKRTLLPLYEVFVRKQVIERTTKIEWLLVDKTSDFLPWRYMTKLRICNEKGIFEYPDILPLDLKMRWVKVRFLRRSKLVLQVEEIT